MTVYGKDFLLLRGKKIPVDLAEVAQVNLKFYGENPRVYTLLRADGKEPTQEDIEETLGRMEHVKQLVQSIKDNGGLIEAIMVQGGTNIVFEGNSRLAAFRILAGQDAIKWGRVKAKVLPASLSESEIFSLLGEYHIIGKKNWAPFEQAGYLYRRHKEHGISVDQLTKEINLKKKSIGHLISVYEFMLTHNERDVVNRWSYYDEYLKSNKIKKARKLFEELDKVIVKKIRSREIERAVDVRDDLKRVVEVGGKVLENFVKGKRDFQESVQAALHKGAGDHGILRLRKFKEWFATANVQTDLQGLSGNVKSECVYELRRIEVMVSKVLKRLSASK